MMVLDPTTWTLESLRMQRDPAADAVVRAIRAGDPRTPDRELIGSLMHQTRAERDSCMGTAPASHACDEVLEWFADANALPDWATSADAQRRIARGQRFFEQWSMPIAASLFCGSLPAAYAAKNGVLVLQQGSDLAGSHVNRRVAETGQMLLDVMHLASAPPSSLQPGGQGYASARGVRLLHAVIRYRLDTMGSWDAAAHGEPVNQEDLLGTVLTFTTVVFRGMERLGLPIDDGAADDYLFTWCVIGHLIGIDADLLPIERPHAEHLMYAIAARQHQPSVAGDELMAALLHEMEQSMPWGMRKLPRALVRHLLDDEIADMLHVRRAWLWSRVFVQAWRLDQLIAYLPGGATALQVASEVVGRSMIRMYLDRTLRGDQPPFRIDVSAVSQMGLANSAAAQRLRHERRRARRAVAGTKRAARQLVATPLQSTPVAGLGAVRSLIDRAALDERTAGRLQPWGRRVMATEDGGGVPR
jgi:hypothetical protein